MVSRTELETRLTFWKEALEEQRAAYLALLRGGVKQFRLKNRELTRFDLPELEASMRQAETKIADIERQLQGRNRARRVVPRW